MEIVPLHQKSLGIRSLKYFFFVVSKKEFLVINVPKNYSKKQDICNSFKNKLFGDD